MAHATLTHVLQHVQQRTPANQLAIKVKFKNKTSDEEEEMWAFLRGKTDSMRVNSLVDFAEGKPEEYTPAVSTQAHKKRKVQNILYSCSRCCLTRPRRVGFLTLMNYGLNIKGSFLMAFHLCSD